VGDLSEKQWVEKANMALNLMEEQEGDKPVAVYFVGVSKEREDRGVIFEMNSGAAAGVTIFLLFTHMSFQLSNY
jgi:hypothetical protein